MSKRRDGPGPGGEPGPRPDEDLELYARGKQAWPKVAVGTERWRDHLARVSAVRDAAERAAPGKEALHAEDLYLALGCLEGSRDAVRAFTDTYLARVPSYVSRVDRSPVFADEVRQELARKLLVGGGETLEAKLATYTGRGPLGGFVRVSAVRVAQNMKCATARPTETLDEGRGGGHAAGPDLDPEMTLLKRRYARDFEEAFRATLASLEKDERSVLRMHHIDGLSIEEVGAAFRVSRATAARWLAKARARIVEETERRLRERLRGAAADPAGPDSGPHVHSLLALVRSQLDLSISRHLRS